MATKTTNSPLKNQTVQEENVSKWEAFIKKNRKILMYVIIGIVVLIAGVLLYQNLIAKPRAEKAATALGACQELFNQQQFEQALKGDGTAVMGFIRVADDYSGTPSGNLANYYAGLCYIQSGKWQEAVGYLEKFKPQDDAVVSPMSQMVLGDVYANLKQYDKAVDAFKKAAKLADKADKRGASTSVSPLALKKAGIVLYDQGRNDEALKIFQEIKEKYAASAVATEMDKYIELVTK